MELPRFTFPIMAARKKGNWENIRYILFVANVNTNMNKKKNDKEE